MKYGPITKLYKGNKATLKKVDNDVISVNCDFIWIFCDLWPIWSNPEARLWTQSFSLMVIF